MCRSSNLVGSLQLIDSIGLRVERPYSPSSRRIPWYFCRSLAHTDADIDPTMPNMCTGAFYVLQRLNNSCAIYAIYTVVYRYSPFLKVILLVWSFLVRQYWKSWFSVLVWHVGYIFPYCPVDEAIRVCMDPAENSVVPALWNTHGQCNTRRVKFQYYLF